MEYTPQELAGVLFYQSRREDDDFKADWERTRVQTFILVNFELDKKNKIPYDRFCREVWPFDWEKRKKASDPDQIMTLDQWQALLNKKTVSEQKVYPPEIK